jgi:transmembrane sensor
MSQSHEIQTGVADIAAQWVVRSQAEAFAEADILALTEWLEADPLNAQAFEDALLIWDDAGTLEARPMAADVVNLSAFRDRKTARKPLWQSPAAMTGIAAALTAAILLPMFALKNAPVNVYETHRGQSQTIALADGSTLQLNTDTRVSVQLSAHARTLVLDRGELALKVTHDVNRPLTLTAGDARITDIGTEFNVRRDGNAVAVAVREGEVALSDTGASTTTLQRGDTAIHQGGTAGATVSHGDPDQAFAWQTAHAIYRDQPLSIVVKDLNRYFDKPIIVDDQAGKLRLSAILTLDSEPLVVRRLQFYLPVQAKTTDSGIYLSADAHPRDR